MADAQRPELSSAFDAMLAHSKRQFDDLYRGGPAHADPPASTPAVRLDPELSCVRKLNERFGSDWRYEISHRQRNGDEVIVLCRLILAKEGEVREQFGRAKVSVGPTAGVSGGVRFKTGRADAEQSEGEAFRRAAEAALMNCADLV